MHSGKNGGHLEWNMMEVGVYYDNVWKMIWKKIKSLWLVWWLDKAARKFRTSSHDDNILKKFCLICAKFFKWWLGPMIKNLVFLRCSVTYTSLKRMFSKLHWSMKFNIFLWFCVFSQICVCSLLWVFLLSLYLLFQIQINIQQFK